MKRHAIGLYCCLLLSCASPHEQGATALYDGDWQAVMHETPAVQLIENLRFNCAPFTESFFLRVSNGIVAGFMEADENYSFTAQINSKGQFRALIPTNSVYTYEASAVSRQSNIVLVLEGKLSEDKRSGLFYVGDSALDGRGCATSVQFVAV